MTPDAYCQARASASGSSFYYSFYFLDAERRRAITALYAFCREVDDVVDDSKDPTVARAKLAWWSDELLAMFRQGGTHPVSLALQPALARYDLPKALFDEMLEGMAMDLNGTVYERFDDLQLYCYRVAATVGLLAARIFGYTRDETLVYAHDLGIAFQLTNIIRDVGEDAARGRCYLPGNELSEAGLDRADIFTRRAAGMPGFSQFMQTQVARANAWYDRALGALPPDDRRAQRPGLIMAAIYRTVLDEIRRDNYRVLEHRISLPPARKLWIACRTALSGRTA